MLNESNDIISGNLVNFFICQGRVSGSNILANFVVLSDKNCMKNFQAIFVLNQLSNDALSSHQNSINIYVQLFMMLSKKCI